MHGGSGFWRESICRRDRGVRKKACGSEPHPRYTLVSLSLGARRCVRCHRRRIASMFDSLDACPWHESNSRSFPGIQAREYARPDACHCERSGRSRHSRLIGCYKSVRRRVANLTGAQCGVWHRVAAPVPGRSDWIPTIASGGAKAFCTSLLPNRKCARPEARFRTYGPERSGRDSDF